MHTVICSLLLMSVTSSAITEEKFCTSDVTKELPYITDLTINAICSLRMAGEKHFRSLIYNSLSLGNQHF